MFEQVLFIVRHGVAEIGSLDAPPVPLELVYYPPTEILVVDRIVGTERSSVEVENDGLVSASRIVTAKIVRSMILGGTRKNCAMKQSEMIRMCIHKGQE